MLMKIVNFVVQHWTELVALGTAVWTIYQQFQLQVLKKDQ